MFAAPLLVCHRRFDDFAALTFTRRRRLDLLATLPFIRNRSLQLLESFLCLLTAPTVVCHRRFGLFAALALSRYQCVQLFESALGLLALATLRCQQCLNTLHRVNRLSRRSRLCSSFRCEIHVDGHPALDFLFQEPLQVTVPHLGQLHVAARLGGLFFFLLKRSLGSFALRSFPPEDAFEDIATVDYLLQVTFGIVKATAGGLS
mmetsp:Transcript_3647/g.11254  ORF Transcript_3647/g.11254 Transcript_3647/m.11254 type:complete len:204 (-) Transcript_3647:1471-2082(-)